MNEDEEQERLEALHARVMVVAEAIRNVLEANPQRGFEVHELYEEAGLPDDESRNPYNIAIYHLIGQHVAKFGSDCKVRLA